jgi:hypothetical protein
MDYKIGIIADDMKSKIKDNKAATYVNDIFGLDPDEKGAEMLNDAKTTERFQNSDLFQSLRYISGPRKQA